MFDEYSISLDDPASERPGDSTSKLISRWISYKSGAYIGYAG